MILVCIDREKKEFDILFFVIMWWNNFLLLGINERREILIYIKFLVDLLNIVIDVGLFE